MTTSVAMPSRPGERTASAAKTPEEKTFSLAQVNFLILVGTTVSGQTSDIRPTQVAPTLRTCSAPTPQPAEKSRRQRNGLEIKTFCVEFESRDNIL